MSKESVPSHFAVRAGAYLKQLQESFSPAILESIESLAKELLQAWRQGRHVYICGNGGSAANAIHMANDFHYGIGACGAGRADDRAGADYHTGWPMARGSIHGYGSGRRV